MRHCISRFLVVLSLSYLESLRSRVMVAVRYEQGKLFFNYNAPRCTVSYKVKGSFPGSLPGSLPQFDDVRRHLEL